MPHQPPIFTLMPTTASTKEAELFHKIHRSYCAAGREAHACVGRVTIDRLGLTFNCPRCGDARSLFPEEAPRDQGAGIGARDQGSGIRDQDGAAEAAIDAAGERK